MLRQPSDLSAGLPKADLVAAIVRRRVKKPSMPFVRDVSPNGRNVTKTMMKTTAGHDDVLIRLEMRQRPVAEMTLDAERVARFAL